MDNRPKGREKRILSGGTGIKRTGTGLNKQVSERNVKRGEELRALKNVIKREENR